MAMEALMREIGHSCGARINGSMRADKNSVTPGWVPKTVPVERVA